MSVQERWHQPEQRPQIWVVCPDEDVFQVYNPSNREVLYQVSGSADAPVCTCPEFQARGTNWQCDHIRAVFQHLTGDENGDAISRSNVAYTGQNGHPSVSVPAGGTAVPCTLKLKRSVSPDGRIDSLSIELETPVNGVTAELEARAQEFLAAQARIADSFLGQGGNARQSVYDNGSNGHTAGKLTTVGGMQTRWGWRTFINVELHDGRRLKLFGSRKHLAEKLSEAGYPHLGSNLSTGTALNVPCQAVLKLSEDGKYTNVERIMPPAPQGR